MKLRRSAAWLAAFAIALQALWPLLAQAKPRSVILVPVCTVDGVTHYSELKAGETPLERRSATHGEHCAFCSVDTSTVLPTAPAAVHDISFTETVAAPPLPSLPCWSLFSPARPRAPPVFS